VKFKMLGNFSFNIFPKSMKGQKREHKGDSPIVDSHCPSPWRDGGESRKKPCYLSIYRKKSASKKKLDSASARKARKTRAQLAAKRADSGEIRPDQSVEANKTAEEGSQIQRSKLRQERRETRQ
jgi:hypothetical protein